MKKLILTSQELLRKYADKAAFILIKLKKFMIVKDKDYSKKFRAQGLPITAVGLSITLQKDADTHKCLADIAVEAL